MNKKRIFILVLVLVVVLLIIFGGRKISVAKQVEASSDQSEEVPLLEPVVVMKFDFIPVLDKQTKPKNKTHTGQYTHEEIMDSIAWCESKGNDQAKNPASSAKGRYQILDGTWKNFECTGNVMDGKDNQACAEKIAADSYGHWSESFSCMAKEKNIIMK